MVEVFDGQSPFARRAEVRRAGSDQAELVVVGEPIPERAPWARLSLAIAFPKGERLDWLVEKAVEVGVSTLIPIQTERSVVDPRPSKLERLRKAVIEASKQCGRNRLMTIGRPSTLEDIVGAASAMVRLLAHPGGVVPGAWPRVDEGGEAWLAVGPEGGFSDREVASARAAGWILASLGPTILRIETAGVVGSALVLAGCGRGGALA